MAALFHPNSIPPCGHHGAFSFFTTGSPTFFLRFHQPPRPASPLSSFSIAAPPPPPPPHLAHSPRTCVDRLGSFFRHGGLASLFFFFLLGSSAARCPPLFHAGSPGAISLPQADDCHAAITPPYINNAFPLKIVGFFPRDAYLRAILLSPGNRFFFSA